MSEAPYVDVIVNVAAGDVDRPFQYVVPADRPELARVGTPVIVPFGRRKVVGIVVGCSRQAVVENLKSIVDRAPGVAELEPSAVELAGWLRREYGCLWIDALRMMLPPNSLGAGSRRVRAVVDVDPEDLSELESRVVAAVRSRLVATVSRLSREASVDARPVVDRLVRRGVLRYSGGRKPSRSRVFTAYRATEDGRDALVSSRLPARATRQRRVLAALASAALSPAAVASATGLDRASASGTLRRLVELGYAKAEPLPMDRRISLPGVRTDHRVPSLTPEQQVAVDAIERALDQEGGTFVLYGVTGSGKTEVYLRAIQSVLSRGKSAVYLVPEISLTPQMLDIFAGRLGMSRLALLHSGMGAGDRRDQWTRAADIEPKLVIGARSASLCPVPEGALFILDEEHETSYKQNESPRYHAREVARRRTRGGGVLVLGSATPSLESYYAAKTGGCHLLELPRRVDDRPLAPVSVVDMREELRDGHRSIFSRALLQALDDTLRAGEQAVLFINRRGHSPFVLCRDCGHVCRCPHCEVSLVFHASHRRLVCHYCGYSCPPPTVCPGCRGERIRQFGAGTERVQQEFSAAFPGVVTVRMDVDTTRARGAHQRLWSAFARGEARVLIGTQMVTKGFDLPNVTTVGAVAADVALCHPDFRAAERTFQLLTQVAGRAGRGDRPGRVVFQTYRPDHYAVEAASRQDYGSFYEKEIEVRRELLYPPFSRLAMIMVAGRNEGRVAERAEMVAREAREHSEWEVLGPAPAPLRRLRGNYRWQLAVFSRPGDDGMGESLRQFQSVRDRDETTVTIDVDAISML